MPSTFSAAALARMRGRTRQVTAPRSYADVQQRRMLPRLLPQAALRFRAYCAATRCWFRYRGTFCGGRWWPLRDGIVRFAPHAAQPSCATTHNATTLLRLMPTFKTASSHHRHSSTPSLRHRYHHALLPCATPHYSVFWFMLCLPFPPLPACPVPTHTRTLPACWRPDACLPGTAMGPRVPHCPALTQVRLTAAHCPRGRLTGGRAARTFVTVLPACCGQPSCLHAPPAMPPCPAV